MENLLNKVDEIVNTILDSKEYKDYLFLKEKIENNEIVMNLISEIKSIEKEMVKRESIKEDISDLELEFNKKMDELNGIPLYIDFISKQEEINLAYKLIKDRLDEYFYVKMN